MRKSFVILVYMFSILVGQKEYYIGDLLIPSNNKNDDKVFRKKFSDELPTGRVFDYVDDES